MTQRLTLREALVALKDNPGADGGAVARIGIACSFTPSHLGTFVDAYARRARPGARVVVEPGIYGDLVGGLNRFADQPLDACAVVLEWPDLDPRLGMRESVGATVASPDDIHATARQRLERVVRSLGKVAGTFPIVITLPALPLPPVYASGPRRISALEAGLRRILAEFVTDVLGIDGVLVASSPAVAGPARDLRGDIRSGFPFSVDFASALAEDIVRLAFPAPAKKGLITDLDDTLWRGLVGEIGADAVTWDLDSGSQVHALYQQLLASLAEQGVLLAVVSKNDPDVVATAMARSDLLVGADLVFPIVASWGPKSAAVTQVLDAWNIGPGDVVFVDDNEMELAEVATLYPQITGLAFQPNDPDAVAELLTVLKDHFWRDRHTAEDAIRLDSLRAAERFGTEQSSAGDSVDFLRDMNGALTLDCRPTGWEQPRALELVNKTNQFNLNGRRLSNSQWRELGTRAGGITCAVSYSDRFGPLGVISVLAGVVDGRRLTVDCWVLSCRAFSRAVEHHILAALAERHGITEIRFDYIGTDRNGIVQQFLQTVGGDDQVISSTDLEASNRVGIHAVIIEA